MDEGDKQLKLKLKCRIFDGTDIDPESCSTSTTIETLKELLLSKWPQDKSIIPKSKKEMKLIHAGKILDDEKELAEYIVSDPSDAEYITIHVVVQPAPVKKRTGKNQSEKEKQGSCSCSIL